MWKIAAKSSAPLAAMGILALALANGCSEGAVGTPQPRPCPSGCPTGTICNNQTGACVPGNTQPPPVTPPRTCAAPTVPCGQACVNLASNPSNCGSCGNACGQNATCQAGCRCLPGFTDCNKTPFDGCECTGACSPTTPTQCASGPAGECDPLQAKACGAEGRYCSNERKCSDCPTGRLNCDGTLGCECAGACNGTSCTVASKCQPSQVNDCGGQGAFCDSATSECANCPTGKLNCDGKFACECDKGTCQACNPTCAPATANSCGANNKQCVGTSCQDCPAGKLNCDGKNDCECATSCNGASCAPAPQTCSPATQGSCGGSTKQCVGTACQDCPTGKHNCDGKNDCECSNGCNGAACAAPPPACVKATAFSCGSDTSKYCNGTACVTCPAGQQNCDGKNECECENGCSGSTCATTPACSAVTFGSCASNTKYCNNGTCANCPAGTLNCDGIGGCDACATGSCDGTSCATAPDPCNPTVVDDCNLDEQCVDNVCKACYPGFNNCNGFGGCECNGTCIVFECQDNQCSHGIECCSRSSASSCPGETQYCALSGTCKACPAGSQNCDGTGDCECTTGCNGTSCKAAPCDPATAYACGVDNQWCNGGTCQACSGTTRNCNGTYGCECETGCSGSVCAGQSCSATTADSCGDKSKWCFNNICTNCSGGYNCNGVSGCECTGPCAGDQCQAGQCSGGECCSRTTYNACGDLEKFCNTAGSCEFCAWGKANCDGTGDCEANAPCTSGCSRTTFNDCGDLEKFCNTSGVCEWCEWGHANCDGKGDCDGEGTCA